MVKKNAIIQEQEQHRIVTEKLLARQPNSCAAEQNNYQRDVKKKSKQMMAMASELNMHHAQVKTTPKSFFADMQYLVCLLSKTCFFLFLSGE